MKRYVAIADAPAANSGSADPLTVLRLLAERGRSLIVLRDLLGWTAPQAAKELKVDVAVAEAELLSARAQVVRLLS